MTVRPSRRSAASATGVLLAAALVLSALFSMAVPAAAAPHPSHGVQIDPPPAITLPPEFDPFYTPTAGAVAAAKPGQIIRARAINPAFMGLISLNVNAWQLVYRSNDSHGAAIPIVTTVLTPRGSSPAGGRKLLSYQIAEDSAAQYCAPSYVIQYGAIPADYVNAAETLIPLAAGVAQGWTVAMPDYEGPNSAYGAARLGAQATLDGIRAVESFAPAELHGAKTPAALWGYSGGTIPTSFAAEIKQAYAPDLNVVGTASGGIAPADYIGILEHNNGGVYAGLISGPIVGIATEYPDMQRELNEHVNLLGQAVLASKRVLCHPQGTSIFPGLNYMGTFNGADPLQLPGIKHAIADNTLGERTPSVPVFMYQAQYDEIIPTAGVDRIANKYCADRAPSVTYERELLAEHISGVITQIPDAFTWIRARLDGIPAVPGCHITNLTSTITEPQFGRVLGTMLPAVAQALIGQAIGEGKH